MANKVTVVLTSLVLAGCTPDLPKIDPAPSTDPQNVSILGDKIDLSEQRAAAAIVVAIENANKPEVVKAEGNLALSYLPAPRIEDITFARDRAAKGDKKAYDDQQAYAKQLQKDLTAMWDKMEEDNKKAKADIQALKNQNNELRNEVSRIEKEARYKMWAVTGAVMFFAGALAWAFIGAKIGIVLLICAVFAGSVPTITDSIYFNWIVGITLGLCACLGLWRLYDYIKDKNNEQP
jgi:outer membrane murein-binding lipoprotein Lpp